MNTPVLKARKAQRQVQLDPKGLFWAMACDLRVWRNELVISAYAQLCDGKYLTFLRTLDTMAEQLHMANTPENLGLYQLAGLFSKYPFDDPSIDRDAVSIKKFQQAEHRCRRQNQKFRLRRHRVQPAHMEYMRNWISRVIGQSPNLASIYQYCDFGPGSSVGVHGQDVSFLAKLSKMTVTPACEPYALAALRQNHHYLRILSNTDILSLDRDWIDSHIHVERVQHNKIVCVPKNAKTSRTIAIEPTLNGFIQKGIDLELRSKLHRFGINLSDQAINQRLARLGSLDGGLATIDLSAASDSISIELVRELLPADWFLLLNATRSPSYQLSKDNLTLRRYEKFCSMGNGFCFPLETLIFSAAVAYCVSVTKPANSCWHVYGDDIIVAQDSALLLLEVLADIGFKANMDKTFIVGPFRESCGADFVLGVNCRPLMIRQKLRPNHECFYLLNELRRRNMTQTWNWLFNQLSHDVKQYTRPYPRDDDSAITVDLDTFMCSSHARWSRDLHTWTWKGIIAKPRFGQSVRNDQVLLAGKLR